MSKVWQYYYESESLYNTVLAIKNRVDPDGVFTPNSLCVGGLGPKTPKSSNTDAASVAAPVAAPKAKAKAKAKTKTK
jgi:hypothetical protein